MVWSVPIAGSTTSTPGSTATDPAAKRHGSTRREFLDWVRAAEADFPVTSWRIRGLRVWPLIRLSLSSSTFRAGSPAHSLSAGLPRLAANIAHGLVEWGKARLLDAGADRPPDGPAGAVFLASSIGRRPLLEGRRYDPRSGPFVDLLERAGVRTAVWEMSPYGDYNVPRYTPSFYLQPYLVALRAGSRVAVLGDDGVELDRYGEFVSRTRAAGWDFPHAELGRLRRDILYLRRLADTFAQWLRHARPQMGFMANASLAEQAFCLACRELGITSVEVQHGVQGDLHPTYGSWTAVPPDGWEVRARVFWNWDPESAAAISRWAAAAPGHHRAIVGGDPWREMWLDPENPISARTHEMIVERKRRTGGDTHILVTLTSQGEAIPADVIDVVRRAPKGWRFWFRLHPVDQASRAVQARSLLREIGADPSLLDFATETPLPALLRHMDCHLTVALSSVVMEAALNGVPSIACSGEATDFYGTESASGMLVVADQSELLEALHAAVRKGRQASSPTPLYAPVAMNHLLSGRFGV